LLKKDEYFSLIEELKNAVGVKSQTPRQYYILKKYEIMQCGDVEKLVEKKADSSGSSDTVYYAHVDEMYDIINRKHIQLDTVDVTKCLKC